MRSVANAVPLALAAATACDSYRRLLCLQAGTQKSAAVQADKHCVAGHPVAGVTKHLTCGDLAAAVVYPCRLCPESLRH